jgi:predicted transcriptional regulator
MIRWFRFYDDALNSPKVQRLDGETFKVWVNLLCLASQNGGKLPHVDDIAFSLRMTQDAALTVVERLLNGGLIDKASGGANGYTYAPHNWSERQYKSDTSTDRVKRFRKRSKTVTETAPDTDTDTEVTLDKSNVASINSDKEFWANAVAYLGGESKRSLIGKWCKDYGKPATAAAITAAQLDRAIEPVAFIIGTLRKGGNADQIAVGI